MKPVSVRSRDSADAGVGPAPSKVEIRSPLRPARGPLRLVQVATHASHSLDIDLTLDPAAFEELVTRLQQPPRVIPQLAAAFRAFKTKQR